MAKSLLPEVLGQVAAYLHTLPRSFAACPCPKCSLIVEQSHCFYHSVVFNIRVQVLVGAIWKHILPVNSDLELTGD